MGDILIFGLANGKLAIVATELNGGSSRSSNTGPLISQCDSLSLPYRISVANKSFQSRSRGSGPVSKQSVFSFGNQSNKKIITQLSSDNIPIQRGEIDVSSKYEHCQNSSDMKEPELAMEAVEIKYYQLHKAKVRSVLYWAEESSIISTGDDGSIVVSDENGIVLKSPPPFKTPIASILLVKRNDRFFKSSAVKKSAKEEASVRKLQGFQKVLNEETSKQSEIVFIEEKKTGKSSKRAQRRTKTDIIEFLALWDLLDNSKRAIPDMRDEIAGNREDHNGQHKTTEAELEELKKINKKLLKICSTLENKNE